MFNLQLPPHIAHIWTIDLNINPDIEQQFLATLSADEHVRANRFHFAIHRQHFIAARGALRQILANYLNLQPAEIIFNYNEYQKPFVHLPKIPIRFNISHSHDLALAAFTYDNEVGIDIEMTKPTYHADVANKYFSKPEQQALQALASQDRACAFYRIWARKEAIIKARGTGLLSDPLDTFSVSIKPIAELLHIYEQTWYLDAVQTDKNYQAAIATKHPLNNIVYYHFTD